MIFTHDNKRACFIHIPKTAGNTIQSAMLESGISLDRKQVLKYQDGNDRFEVIGEQTKAKHQHLARYLQVDNTLSTATVFGTIREPFQRLLSLYFSPHRFFMLKQHQGGTAQTGLETTFDENEFAVIVDSAECSFRMLTPRLFRMPEKMSKLVKAGIDNGQIKIIRYSHLASDCQSILNLTIKQRLNQSTQPDLIKKLSQSKVLRRYVETSKHKTDYEVFESFLY